MKANFEFQNWGLIDYERSLEKQYSLVESTSRDSQTLGTLVFCSHPPVVTLGRKTQPEDIFAWTGPTIEVNRGGRATYHGPSQLVVYPIFNLKKISDPPDVVKFLRSLENIVISALKTYEVVGTGRTRGPQSEGTDLEDTGVWVGEKKLASVGIAVKNWVSYHGVAINLHRDPTAFQGMKPCGYSAEIMTSLEDITQNRCDSQKFEDILLKKFEDHFQRLK